MYMNRDHCHQTHRTCFRLMLLQQSFGPLVWFGINVQVHAGRSNNRRTSRRLLADASSRRTGATAAAKKRVKAGITSTIAGGPQLVVPTETPASP